MSTPLNQSEGITNSIPQVLDVKNSHIRNKFSTSFPNPEPSMGQALLKYVPKLKVCPHFSGKVEYDHMELMRVIDMVKEDFELQDSLFAAVFDTFSTKSAKKWYIKLRQAHGHQSWTWWKSQIINKWANDYWIFIVETAFESGKLISEMEKALLWFFQQKYRLT
ncbi:hypothetical protein O181_069164 [Austropuccinia psidii MF-1]|uniref:Uncharacterized protein n=1 Tax=Austropuccinia psidii MF-1 TaxID=1389203 RepID=A0A9Q3I895_9BASI|nr:hypothetical protein [Austropuccinia psidii MF-1]